MNRIVVGLSTESGGKEGENFKSDIRVTFIHQEEEEAEYEKHGMGGRVREGRKDMKPFCNYMKRV